MIETRIEKTPYYDWTHAIAAVLDKTGAAKTVSSKLIKNLSEVVNSIFFQIELPRGSFTAKTFPFPLYVDGSKRRLFFICKSPMAVEEKNGGWKEGYSSLMFEDVINKVTLVWGLIDKFINLERCIEYELSKNFPDECFWPAVQYYYKEGIESGEKIETRRYLFSDRYECDFATAQKKYLLMNIDRITLVKQVAEALAFLHKINLIHGDIKPSNILIGKRAVLCDFDLSFYQNSEVPMFEMYGTPCFSSPELVAPSREGFLEDYKPSDMYALGVSLLEPNFHKDPLKWPKKIEQYITSFDRRPFIREYAYLQQQGIYEECDKSLRLFRKDGSAIINLYETIKNALLHPDMHKRPSAERLISYIKMNKIQEVKDLFDSISKHPKSSKATSKNIPK